MADFNWDPNKRQKTLDQRGLDFADAKIVFEDDYAFFAPDPRYDFDDRWLVIGRLHNKMVVIAYKETAPDKYRIISMRLAEKQEVARYEEEKIKQPPTQCDALVELLDKLARDRQLQEEIDLMKEEAQQWRQPDGS